MDKPKPISPTDLYLELGTARAPVLIDVRTDADFDGDVDSSSAPVACPKALNSGKSNSRGTSALSFMAAKAAERVLAEAKAVGAVPYDIPDVEFTHEGERCSFDTLLRIYDIADPPLQRLAPIVRGADTSRHDLAPQCAGLFAISLGLSANVPDDHTMLAHGMMIYDALYTWCRSLQAETHGWPPAR
jgi:hypothetical protein